MLGFRRAAGRGQVFGGGGVAVRRRGGGFWVVALLAVCGLAGPVALAQGTDPVSQSEPPPDTLTASVVGEVEEARTATSRTLELSDGSFRTEEFLSAINFQDGGEWKAIDTTLVPDGDGFTSRANDVDVEIPESIQDGPVVLQIGGDQVGFQLQGADAAAQVDDATVTFADALPHVAVEYEALGRAVKETLVLSSRDAAAEYDFDLDASAGLTPRLRDSGEVELVDAGGEARFVVAAPWMVDGAGELSRAARYALVEEAGQTVLRLQVSRKWLDDPARQYPVEVDPTVSGPISKLCELTNGQASEIPRCDDGSFPVWVGREQGNTIHRVIADFDLGTVPRNALVYAADVVAQYEFRAQDDDLLPSTIDLHLLSTGFDDTATWTRARTEGITPVPWATAGGTFESERESATDLAADQVGGNVYFSAGRLTQGWRDGDLPRNGLLLKSRGEHPGEVDVLKDLRLAVEWRHRIGRSRDYTYEQIGPVRDSSVAVNVGNGNLAYAGFDFTMPADGSPVHANRLYNSRDIGANLAFGTDGRNNGPLDLFLQRRASGNYLFQGPQAIMGIYHRRPNGSFRSPSTFANTTLTLDGAGNPSITFHQTGERWEFGSERQLKHYVAHVVRQLPGPGDSVITHLPADDSPVGGRSAITTYPNPTESVLTHNFGTDANVDTAQDTSGLTISFGYDATTRLLTGARRSATWNTAYGYDTANRLSSIGTPLGLITVGYDLYDRVTSATYDPAGTAAPQTTTFLYTGPSAPCDTGDITKTTVTKPDGTRRTYCSGPKLDVPDTWNPTPKPGGPWFDLRDDYVNGGTHDLWLAAQDTGSGITRVALEKLMSDGNWSERLSMRTGCVIRDAYDSPTVLNDPLCPTNYSTSTPINAGPLLEGAHRYKLVATDRTGRTGESSPWTVYVDKTAPTPPAAFRLDYFDGATGLAAISWESVDPDLSDGSPGSGRADGEARYAVNGGAFSAWAGVDGTEIELTGRAANDRVIVEARSRDDVGNTSEPVSSQTITLGPVAEDPDLEAMAVDWFVEQYEVTASVARPWLRVQQQADGMEDDIADVSEGRFAGIWFDNVARRVKVNHVSETSTQPLRDVVARYGLTATTDLVPVRSSVHDLESGKAEITQALADLVEAGKVAISRDEAGNRLLVKIPALTAAEKSRVDQAAAQSPVTATVQVVPAANLAVDTQKCVGLLCDPPLRGGVGIREAEATSGGCTAGFNMYSVVDLKPYLLTAGHCLTDIGKTWSNYITGLRRELVIGPAWSEFSDRRGDGGIIAVTGPEYKNSRCGCVLVDKSGQPGDGRVDTKRDTKYRIRKQAKSVIGDVYCMTGKTTGTHCGKVVELDAFFNVKDSKEKVDHAGVLDRCHKDVSPNPETLGGDSGGPYYKNNVAYGVHTGSIPETKGCRLAYQGLVGVEKNLNVRVLTAGR